MGCSTHFWSLFLIYTSLETPENQRFSDVFRGCKMGSMVRNRLINGILSNEIFNNCFTVTKFLRKVILNVIICNGVFQSSSKLWFCITHESKWRQETNLEKQSSEMLCKKGALKNVANFTGKHLCWSLFSIKLRDFCDGAFYENSGYFNYFRKKLHCRRPATLLKRLLFINTFWRTSRISSLLQI